MATDSATRRRADQTMMAGYVPGEPTNSGAFEATFGR
jgi:hypothetical protein